ncbi:MAG: hypothetical protein ACHQRM_00625 [Bacteroidia bacterium]
MSFPVLKESNTIDAGSKITKPTTLCFMTNQSAFTQILFVIILLSGTVSFSQDSPAIKPAIDVSVTKTNDENLETRKIYKRKGTLYYYWGYNRAFYTHSDMNFRGTGYNFTITDLAATDDAGYRPGIYFNPLLFTIPQYNQRFGYFFSDKNFITVGQDHMKYVLNRQTSHLTGSISDGVNAGSYDNTDVLVAENSQRGSVLAKSAYLLPHGFVTEFEHCDGLNDVSAEIGHLEQLWISKNARYALSALGSVGAGAVIPDTDADVLGQAPKHDMSANKKAFHLAGYSFSGSAGVQFDVCNHFFIQGKVKAGYMNLPDINTTVEGGKASQQLMFVEPMMVVGYYHLIGKHK